jgi:phenylpropionate dioxygenase-like ring-hydroxylating dioxygenase large terminal subunit
MTTAPELLDDCWYVAAHAADVPIGKTKACSIANRQLLLGRTSEGEVFALKDFCPHRGIPLRFGRFDGKEVECCYHGWRFNAQGSCTAIPSLTDEDKQDVSKICTPAYPCEEAHGLIWVYVPRDEKNPGTPPPVPTMPVEITGGFYHVESVELTCHIDHAVIGLMDPAHGPFVHQSWWWRSKRSMHVKKKQFEPRAQGFVMASHKPSSNSRAYKILGSGERKTEIGFQLPGRRIEHIQVGDHHIVLLTALTPQSATSTVLHQYMFTTIRALNWLRPVLKPFGKAFIAQDVAVVNMQQQGLRANPDASLMLLGDADAQAVWYFRLKKEYLEAQSQNRAFENKLKPRTLSWRS